MNQGEATVDFVIRPVPDTRDEADETVTVTIQPDAAYVVGSPLRQTITITDDDDVVNLPANGWKLTVMASSSAAEGLGINNLGQAVGNMSWYFPSKSGFLWDNGSFTYLLPWYYNYPDQNFSTARAVNNSGIAVGRWFGGTPSNPTSVVPVFWSGDGEYTYLTTLPGLSGGSPTLQDAAEDINDAGIIVGQVGSPFVPGNVGVVAWRPDGYGNYPQDSMVNLGDLTGGSLNGFAAAINEFGEVVGKSETFAGAHAFRSRVENGTLQALDPQRDDMGTATFNDADTSEARDINGVGELVGTSRTFNGQDRAMYKPRTGKNQGWRDLGVLGQGTVDVGNWSQARGINNQGVIVGQSTVYIHPVPWARVLVNRAFVVSNQGEAGSQPLINLTGQSWIYQTGNWYTAASQGWAIINAERINDSNWIVATAARSGVSGAYAVLLTPR